MASQYYFKFLRFVGNFNESSSAIVISQQAAIHRTGDDYTDFGSGLWPKTTRWCSEFNLLPNDRRKFLFARLCLTAVNQNLVAFKIGLTTVCLAVGNYVFVNDNRLKCKNTVRRRGTDILWSLLGKEGLFRWSLHWTPNLGFGLRRRKKREVRFRSSRSRSYPLAFTRMYFFTLPHVAPTDSVGSKCAAHSCKTPTKFNKFSRNGSLFPARHVLVGRYISAGSSTLIGYTILLVRANITNWTHCKRKERMAVGWFNTGSATRIFCFVTWFWNRRSNEKTAALLQNTTRRLWKVSDKSYLISTRSL